MRRGTLNNAALPIAAASSTSFGRNQLWLPVWIGSYKNSHTPETTVTPNAQCVTGRISLLSASSAISRPSAPINRKSSNTIAPKNVAVPATCSSRSGPCHPCMR